MLAKFRRTPLAWRMLVHDKKRLFLSIMGVTFAVFLMFIEMGFMNGVYDSQVLLLDRLNADLVIIHRMKDAELPPKPFCRERAVRLREVPGVAAVYSVYVDAVGKWKTPRDRIDYIQVIGLDPDEPALLIPELERQRETLRRADVALSDSRCRPLFAGLTEGAEGELNGRKLRIGGNFSLGPDFVFDGRLVMSDRNFVTYVRDPRSGAPNFDRVEYGLVQLERGADLEKVRQEIAAEIPPEVQVLSKRELIRQEEQFWAENQPVGIVFGLGMAVGFIIGVAVCYQILFTDVNDHLDQFATLKAMGYSNRFLVGVVLREAFFLSVLAFLPGLLLAAATYSSLEEMTGISMRMTAPRAAAVLVMTVAMCLVSATVAVRKVLQSDPAEVF